MDRRLLLALALSAIVILLFNVVISPPPKQTVAPDSTALGRAPELATPREATPESAVEGALALDQAAAEELTEVTTPHVHARFTSRGARLLSWQLLDFDAPTGPVELIRGGEGELGLLLETAAGTRSLDEVLFHVEQEDLPDGGRAVRFSAGLVGGIQVRKTFVVPPSGHLARLLLEVDGATDASSVSIVWAAGIPPSESNEKLYLSSVSTVALVGTNRETIRPGSLRRQNVRDIEGNIRWAGVRNKYFGALIIPPENVSTRLRVTGNAEANITGVELPLPLSRGAARHDVFLYLGPLDYNVLRGQGHGLEMVVDLGWKIVRPISQFLLIVMEWMYRFIPNYGWVIIILSALTKVLFYPLTKSSIRSMRAMQRLQPQMQAIRDKHKTEPQKMNKAMMDLYKEHKVNPVGGCLPMLLQMPVFIGLYQVLANTIDMRGAGFMLWMDDLSVPETLFTIGSFPIHALPIIMCLASLVQQKLTPTPDPRQKMIGYMMPAMMLFMFYSFPAGLSLYWTVNTVLTAAQQWWIHREEPAGAPAPSAA